VAASAKAERAGGGKDGDAQGADAPPAQAGAGVFGDDEARIRAAQLGGGGGPARPAGRASPAPAPAANSAGAPGQPTPRQEAAARPAAPAELFPTSGLRQAETIYDAMASNNVPGMRQTAAQTGRSRRESDSANQGADYVRAHRE
jgi:hypothetical protein